MLNKYPLWKTLMVLFIVAIGAIYALPNLYPEDPAVQISGLRGIETTAATLDTVKSHLDENKISYASIAMATDYDCWRENTESVTFEMVMKIIKILNNNYARVIYWMTALATNIQLR